ncbi:hypothetical protein IAU59_000717 [Kwoniella sp. CBS 9459]
MPPKRPVRYSSPNIRSSRGTKAPTMKPRASEPAQVETTTKGEKRKLAANSDDEYEPFKNKTKRGKKEDEVAEENSEDDEDLVDDDQSAVNENQEVEGEEEEQEEEEEEEEQIEAEAGGHSQGGLGDIVRDLSAQFQSKKSIKVAKQAGEKNTQLTKLDELFDRAFEEMDELHSGESGREQRKQRIDGLTSDLIKSTTQASKDLEKLQNVNNAREARLHSFRPKLAAYLNDYHVPMVDALRAARTHYGNRPKAVQDTIKYFAKMQKERMRENEEKTQTHLDAKAMTRQSRKMMRAAIKGE